SGSAHAVGRHQLPNEHFFVARTASTSASSGQVAVTGRTVMNFRNSISAIALVAALCVTLTDAWAQDMSKYPDWNGQWNRRIIPGLGGQPSHDQTKPWGFGQQAPLTPEYTKIMADSLADQ